MSKKGVIFFKILISEFSGFFGIYFNFLRNFKELFLNLKLQKGLHFCAGHMEGPHKLTWTPARHLHGVYSDGLADEGPTG